MVLSAFGQASSGTQYPALQDDDALSRATGIMTPKNKKIPKTYCCYCGKSLTYHLEDGVKRLYCSDCRAFHYENPLPAYAVVALTEKKNGVLLIKRGVEPAAGMWALPGGFMEVGETLEEGAARELKEETGLDAKDISLLALHEHMSDIYGQVIILGYLAEGISGKLKAGADAKDAKWFALDELPLLAFESHRELIDKAVSKDV